MPSTTEADGTAELQVPSITEADGIAQDAGATRATPRTDVYFHDTAKSRPNPKIVWINLLIESTYL